MAEIKKPENVGKPDAGAEQAVRKEEKLPRFRPPADVVEREDGFHVYMDLPGVKREDLVIDLQEGELTVSGVTRYATGDKENYSEMQFGNGEYRRTLAVSDMVDRSAITASLKDGVLELVLPKLEEVKPRRIEIQHG